MRSTRLAACVGALAIFLLADCRANAAGALATGKCGAFGYAFDDDSPEAAALRARAQCKGAECKVVTSFRNTCAAFAVDVATTCGPNGWAQATTRHRAEDAASQACQKFGGRTCKIRVWVCDAKG